MDLNKENTKKILVLVLFSGFLFWSLSHISTIVNLIGDTLSIATPFILGLCFSFIMNVLLRPIEKIWDRYLGNKSSSKFKRPICLLLTISIIIGSIFILLFIVVPEVQESASMIVDMFPQYMIQIEQWWLDVSAFLNESGVILPQLEFDMNEFGKIFETYLKDGGYNFIGKAFDFTTSIFTVIFNVVLGLVFSFYILGQKEKLGGQVKKVLFAYFSHEKANKTLHFFSLTDRVFTNFTAGQLTESIIIGVLCFIGMIVFRIPYAPAISVLVGFTALIPVFGAFFGTAIGAFLILMVSPIKAFWFVVYIIVLQQMEGDIIYPKVVGKSVGLPSIWVLVAVTLGGSAYGILGMLLSVPIVSILYYIIKQKTDQRLKEKGLNI